MTDAAQSLMWELLARYRRWMSRASGAPRGDPGKIREQLRKQLVAEAAGSVEACLSVGAMTEEESEAWLKRIEGATHEADAAGKSVPPGAPEKAEALLTEEVGKLERARSKRVPVIVERCRFVGLLNAYQHLGVLSDAERAAWQARGLPPREPAQPSPKPPWSYEALDLRRAVPCASVRRHGVRLTSIDLYADCTIVRWHLEVSESDVQVDLSGELEDDLDTPYRRIDGPYDGDVSVAYAESVRGFTVFTPATPDEATAVTFRILSQRFEVALN